MDNMFHSQIFFETFIFCLICWNGLMRPRYARNKLVQQLYFDGIVYFFVSHMLVHPMKF